MQKKIKLFIVLFVLMWVGMQATEKVSAEKDELTEEIHLSFDFAGEKALDGWRKTKTIDTSMQPTGLELSGEGWDSKIYRRVKLPAGHYVLSACGRGEVLAIILHDANWSKKKNKQVDLNLANQKWRTDWRPFDTDGKDMFLVVSVGSSKSVESAIKWLKIDSAVVLEEKNLPTPQELAKERPVPQVVRGVTSPFTTKALAQRMGDLAQMGANVVRFSIRIKPIKDGHGLGEMNPNWEQTLNDLVEFVAAAKAVGIKVVPVIGGQVVADELKPSDHAFWEHPDLAKKLSRIWQDIARKLLPYRENVWGYDLYNEALDWSQMPYAPRQWREVAKQIIKSIREVDQESWVIYESGPGGLAWGFSGLKPLPDKRVIYSAHFYSPHEFTHQGIKNIALTDLTEAKKDMNIHYPSVVNGLLWNKEQIKRNLSIVADFQKKYHVPILIGEFSVVRWAPKEDGERYLSDLVDIFESNGWSWMYHSFRGFNGWDFEMDNSYWQKSGPKPKRVDQETQRARIIKNGWSRNKK